MGRHGQYDLYYCPKPDAGGGSVIARFGNDAPDYASSPVSTALAHDLDLTQHPDAAHVAYVRLARRLLHEGYVYVRCVPMKAAERYADYKETWDDILKVFHAAVMASSDYAMAPPDAVTEAAYNQAARHCRSIGLDALIPPTTA